jgi:hypothetical protein
VQTWYELSGGVLLICTAVVLRCLIFSEQARARRRIFSPWLGFWKFLTFLCSLLVPGLGQAMNGRHRIGLVHLALFATIAFAFGPICFGIGILSAAHTLLV